MLQKKRKTVEQSYYLTQNSSFEATFKYVGNVFGYWTILKA